MTPPACEQCRLPTRFERVSHATGDGWQIRAWCVRCGRIAERDHAWYSKTRFTAAELAAIEIQRDLPPAQLALLPANDNGRATGKNQTMSDPQPLGQVLDGSISEAIMARLEAAAQEGHCYLDLDELARDVVFGAVMRAASEGLVVVRDGRVFLTRLDRAEQQCADTITQLVRRPGQ